MDARRLPDAARRSESDYRIDQHASERMHVSLSRHDFDQNCSPLKRTNPCRKQNFDGLVLEHGYTLNNHISPLLIGLANQLHEVNKKIILVIPVRTFSLSSRSLPQSFD
jgi:hypothetical protein